MVARRGCITTCRVRFSAPVPNSPWHPLTLLLLLAMVSTLHQANELGPRFLLLHGWLQDHTAWGRLPHQLIARYGGEAVLLGRDMLLRK